MKKILLYTSGSLGDILVLFPILAGIRAKYPDAHITLLNKHKPTAAVSPIDLALRAGYADEIRCVSKSALKLWRFFSLFPYPGRRRYDLVFYLQRDGRMLARKIARERRFFERISREPVRGAVELAIPERADGSCPRVGELMLARINHGSNEPIVPGSHKIVFSAEESADADRVLAGFAFPENAIPFAVCVGGKGSAAHWPLDKYATVLRKVCENTDGVPVFLGGRQDREAILSIMKELPAGRAFYAETAANNLPLSLAVMSKLKFYLGNDTGSIHMAAAAGLRCIGVCSSHDPAGLWYPLGEGHRILRCSPEPECAGCRRAECRFGTPSWCIDAITVDEVADAVGAMLSGK